MTDTDTGAGDELTAGELATTTKTKDWLGRPLVNIATAAADHVGRACKAGDLDYLGRPLVT
jgi:hypothetical protein